jgi:hypothetical protein
MCHIIDDFEPNASRAEVAPPALWVRPGRDKDHVSRMPNEFASALHGGLTEPQLFEVCLKRPALAGIALA